MQRDSKLMIRETLKIDEHNTLPSNIYNNFEHILFNWSIINIRKLISCN